MADIRKLVERISEGNAKEGIWGALMDAVEETADPHETWLDVLEQLEVRDPNRQHSDQAEAARRMFRGIASVAYPYAVNLLLNLDLHRTGQEIYAVDGMNTAAHGADWDAQLRRTQVEEVLREQGNLKGAPLAYRELRPIEPEEGEGVLRRDIDEDALRITVNGQEYASVSEERRHSLWLAFAPEWMDDLEDGEYLTLVTDGGGYQSAMPDFLLVGGDEVWQKVAEPAHSAEAECPLLTWDPEENADGRDRKVTLEETYYGDHPGRECRLCGIKLGEIHGHIYIGEGAESVYVRLVEEDGE